MLGGTLGGQLGGVAFEADPHLKEIINGGILGGHGGGQGITLAGVGGTDKGPLTLAMLKEAHGDQLIDGIANGGPADRQRYRQIPFRQDLLARLEFTFEDQFPELFEHLIGNSFRFDWLEIHSRGWDKSCLDLREKCSSRTTS